MPRFGDYPVATVAGLTDTLLIVQAGATKQISLNLLRGSGAIGRQFWNGTTWGSRPADVLWVEFYSDGTGGSTRSSTAPSPAAVDGDRWWDAA